MLARQAAAQGLAIESWPPLAGKCGPLPPNQQSATPSGLVEACERLKSFAKRHGLSLGGLTLRELRHL